MNDPVKVQDSSRLWSGKSEPEFGHWIFEGVKSSNNSFDYYLYKYLWCCRKYGILVPSELNISGSIGEDLFFKKKSEGESKSQYGIPMLYWSPPAEGELRGEMQCGSYLFRIKDGSPSLEWIYDLRALRGLARTANGIESPLSVHGTAQSSRDWIPSLYLELESNVFFNSLPYSPSMQNSYLNYPELRNIEEWCDHGIDNSVSSLLNATRLNSFIRDIFSLNSYFCSVFSCGSNCDEVVKDGVLLGGDLIYYEDVVPLIHDMHKYPCYTSDKFDVNADEYHSFCESPSAYFHTLFT